LIKNPFDDGNVLWVEWVLASGVEFLRSADVGPSTLAATLHLPTLLNTHMCD
jgi:hypothetical protein